MLRAVGRAARRTQADRPDALPEPTSTPDLAAELKRIEAGAASTDITGARSEANGDEAWRVRHEKVRSQQQLAQGWILTVWEAVALLVFAVVAVLVILAAVRGDLTFKDVKDVLPW